MQPPVASPREKTRKGNSAASTKERKLCGVEASLSRRAVPAATPRHATQVRSKEREFTAMAKLKARTEDAYRRLAADIAHIKHQKVGGGVGWGIRG